MQAGLGPIYKTVSLGDTMVWIHDPEDTRTLLSRDGHTPRIPGFDTFIEQRRTEKEFMAVFKETTGLIAQV